MFLPINVGSTFNYNKEPYELLEDFVQLLKSKLINIPILNIDKTLINISTKRT